MLIVNTCLNFLYHKHEYECLVITGVSKVFSNFGGKLPHTKKEHVYQSIKRYVKPSSTGDRLILHVLQEGES